MKPVLLLSAFLLLNKSIFSQACSRCFIKPKVVAFDLDMQLPKPTDKKTAEQWANLYSLGELSREFLKNANRGCLRLVPPATISTTQTTAPAPGAQQAFCHKADYLIAGDVHPSGDGYVLHLELQTSCSRQALAKADQSFHSSDDTAYLRSIAEKAAMQLGPLSEKINQFAVNQRKADKEVAISNGGGTISVEPKKDNLLPGEETEVQIALNDCDGAPLAGRKISFVAEAVDGGNIEGTTGGTVTPSQVITDASGKATVKFKMGKDKSAVIRPHTVYKKPSGDRAVMRGGRKLPRELAYVTISLLYSREEETTGDISAFMPLLKGQKKRTTIQQDYWMNFDHISKDAHTGYLILSVPEEGQDRNNVVDEGGTYSYIDDDPEVTLDTRGGAIEVQEQISQHNVVKEEREVGPNPKRGASVVFFLGNDKEPMHFDLALNFENEEDLATGSSLTGAASLSISPSTPGATFKVIKLSDPIYKKEYRIEYINKDLGSVDELNKLTGNHLPRLTGALYYTGTELLTVRILSSY